MSEKIAKLIIYTLIICDNVLVALSGNMMFKGDKTSFVVGIILFIMVLSSHITFMKEVVKELDNES